MNCAHENCSLPTSGKSKYCREHKAAARLAWVSMVRSESMKRAQRDSEYITLYEKADAAGKAAAVACVPNPMVVCQGDAIVEVVNDGVCGFAWVTVRPGNSSFALWLKKNMGARRAYYGGMELWVSSYGQSMARKEAYAQAFANVLREAGINAYAGSRMD